MNIQLIQNGKKIFHRMKKRRAPEDTITELYITHRCEYVFNGVRGATLYGDLTTIWVEFEGWILPDQR